MFGQARFPPHTRARRILAGGQSRIRRHRFGGRIAGDGSQFAQDLRRRHEADAHNTGQQRGVCLEAGMGRHVGLQLGLDSGDLGFEGRDAGRQRLAHKEGLRLREALLQLGAGLHQVVPVAH